MTYALLHPSNAAASLLLRLLQVVKLGVKLVVPSFTTNDDVCVATTPLQCCGIATAQTPPGSRALKEP